MHIIEDEYAPPNRNLFLNSTVSNELDNLRICIYSNHATSSYQLKSLAIHSLFTISIMKENGNYEEIENSLKLQAQ